MRHGYVSRNPYSNEYVSWLNSCVNTKRQPSASGGSLKAAACAASFVRPNRSLRRGLSRGSFFFFFFCAQLALFEVAYFSHFAPSSRFLTPNFRSSVAAQLNGSHSGIRRFCYRRQFGASRGCPVGRASSVLCTAAGFPSLLAVQNRQRLTRTGRLNVSEYGANRSVYSCCEESINRFRQQSFQNDEACGLSRSQV